MTEIVCSLAVALCLLVALFVSMAYALVGGCALVERIRRKP